MQIEKNKEGVQNEAIHATFEAFPPLRRVTIVDEDVNNYDPLDVEWAVATRHDPEKGGCFTVILEIKAAELLINNGFTNVTNAAGVKEYQYDLIH